MFSDREEKIIKIVTSRKMTIEQISNVLFKTGMKPFDSTITISNSIRRIIKKCEHHKLDWTLKKYRVNNKLVITKEKLC